MRIKHIVISRLWFDDKKLMDSYLDVAKKVLVPALKTQTCQDFELGIIVKNEDANYVREKLGIEFTAFNGMEDFKDFAVKDKYNIQTRHDIDDWMSKDYIEKIRQTYEQEHTKFDRVVIHAHPVKASYPGWEESEMREYSGKHTSMFLSLCQKDVKHTVFDMQHGMMYSLADKVIKLPKGYAKWVQHNSSVSNTRDKVKGKMILSGPDNVLHVWTKKPPKPTDRVLVRYVNGKIRDHPRKYAEGIVKQGIGRIIEKKDPPIEVFMPAKERIIGHHDKDYKIGVVIVCYETPELIKRAVNSVSAVKGVKVVIVDNSPAGSECYKTCGNLAIGENIEVIHTGKNIFHGPGLHRGIESLTTEYVCVMDSDAYVTDPSVFDKMVDALRDTSVYAVGPYVEHVAKESKLYKGAAFDYLKPWFSMFRINTYYQYSPFVHHGSPWCQSMIDIRDSKRVVQIPEIKKCVVHDHCGTYKVAGSSWSKGWHSVTIRKQFRVLMICFVYNEINYLPHVIKFWKNQGVDVYVIDNISDDGTWEWLQKNDIPSHQFDTKGMFHLDWLQDELTKTLHKLKPDWVIYGAADLYYGFGEPIKNVIQKADSKGYNQIKAACWFGVNTGEKRRLPLIENYFHYKPFIDIVMISKYDKSIRFTGDHIHLPERKIVHVKGIILNYGSCKSPEEQEIKLKRRQKAWDAGMTKMWGSHYRSGKQISWIYKREDMKDIRKSEYYGYYKGVLSLCESQQMQAYASESVKKFKDSLFARFDLVPYRDVNSPVVILGMYRPEDYELFKNHKGEITVVWRGSDSTMLSDERLQILHKKSARHIAISKFISDDLKRYSIPHEVIPVTGSKPDLKPCPRGEYIYHYGKTALYGVKYLDEIERRTGIKIIRTQGKHTQQEVFDIYKKCFIGLRLTSHDGLPNTVIEMGLMGRRCIYNGGTPHSISWKNVDDICESIKKEYARKDEDNTQISADIKEYIEIGKVI